MTLQELLNDLEGEGNLVFRQADGTSIPPHFHITEVGLITRSYIDCGGRLGQLHSVNMQIHYGQDTDHRLSKSKFKGILTKSLRALNLPNVDIEVEYQWNGTIGKFKLGKVLTDWVLIPTSTDCLAKDHCGIPQTFEESNSGCCSTKAGEKQTVCCA